MSKIREKVEREKVIDVILLCAIIISTAIIIIPHLAYEPPSEALVPGPPSEITLKILTNLDVSIQYAIRNSFLVSPYADDNNIANIQWLSPGISTWRNQLESNSIDLVLCPWITGSWMGLEGWFEPMPFSITSGVNETIAGAPMKTYLERSPIFCSYSMTIQGFVLLVNDTLLQEYGLSVPKSIDELLSPSYWPNDLNDSLIGIDIPEWGSIGHQFQYQVTQLAGWENGVRDLTVLYANSEFYENEGDAIEALLNGEIAITLTFSFGLSHEQLPLTISKKYLDNLFIVGRNVVGIANQTQHQTQSEAFIEFLLSPEGQAMLLMDESHLLPVCRHAFDVEQNEIDDSILEEFDWISRAEGVSTMSWSPTNYALWLYMNSTVFSTGGNLSHTWKNIFGAYENGSINSIQFNQFSDMLGEPLTIIDPNSSVNESFTRYYALSLLDELQNSGFLLEITHLWRVAANLRCETIMNVLSVLI